MCSAFQDKPQRRKSVKRGHITFNEEEEVINPEDIDPSVGRFRNLIQTTVIPKKRARTENLSNHLGVTTEKDTAAAVHEPSSHYLDSTSAYSTAARLGISVPNLAPDISANIEMPVVDVNPRIHVNVEVADEPEMPKKKKYAKEAWPGRKPSHLLV